MAPLTIGFGLLMMIISIGTYAAAEGQSEWAFAPAGLGLAILACGVGSLIKKEYRMHLMHGAVLLVAIGVIYPLIRLLQFMFPIDGDSLTVLRNLLVPLACGAYLYFAIQTFITARRNRNANHEQPLDATRPEADDVA